MKEQKDIAYFGIKRFEQAQMKLVEEDDQKEQDVDGTPDLKVWFYLLIIFLIGTGYSWQKYALAYAFGYQAIDPA